jgi:ABC-2 type transport system permease protein
VTQPGTIGWFARHEALLAWRDWLSLMSGGRTGGMPGGMKAGNRRRVCTVALGFLAFALFMHGLAWLMLSPSAQLIRMADAHDLLVITGTLVLAASLMLSQAMESVTRAFYARGDLELILTSPARSSRLFAVRIVAMAVTVLFMTLIMTGPFINVLAWLGSAGWLGGYVVAAALAMLSVAVALVIAGALFRLIGPRRTRIVAQILAAVVGAAFAITVQFAAILSYGTMAVPRVALLSSFASDGNSVLLWPARAVVGDPAALLCILGVGVVALAATIRWFAPRFGHLALAAGSVSHVTKRQGTKRGGQSRSRFPSSPAAALRRKEWILLLRDPWLMSQTLMQLLYLLPAAFLVWRNFYGRGDASGLLVPILIVTAGQLGGGLAWLAVSGEDAAELIASAPVSATRVLRAKAEAVLGGIAIIFGPFVIMLALAAPFPALVAFAGVVIASSCSTAIQYWFRTQARRSLFRRRQTSSRVATFAEALSSTGWAGTGALAATGTWLAVIPGCIVFLIVAGAWIVSPARASPVT